jgi:hypothetical protein
MTDKNLIIDFLSTSLVTHKSVIICTIVTDAGVNLTAGYNITAESLKIHFIDLIECGTKPYQIAQALAAANNHCNKYKP